MSFLILLFAHLIADYPLQGDFLAKAKGSNFMALISHAGIWTGCIAITGFLIGFDIGYVDILLLFSVHTIADYLKASNRLWYKNMDALKGGLVIDQLIHVAQILLLMYMNF